MIFKNLEVDNLSSLIKSLHIDFDAVNKFVCKFNSRVIENHSITLSLLELDNMTKEEEKCFCYLALIGLQVWIDRSLRHKDFEN